MGRKHSGPDEWKARGYASDKEVFAYAEWKAEQQGREVRRESGRHNCIVIDGQRIPVPNEREIKRGTLGSIIKALAAVSLANIGLAIVCPDYARFLIGLFV